MYCLLEPQISMTICQKNCKFVKIGFKNFRPFKIAEEFHGRFSKTYHINVPNTKEKQEYIERVLGSRGVLIDVKNMEQMIDGLSKLYSYSDLFIQKYICTELNQNICKQEGNFLNQFSAVHKFLRRRKIQSIKNVQYNLNLTRDPVTPAL